MSRQHVSEIQNLAISSIIPNKSDEIAQGPWAARLARRRAETPGPVLHTQLDEIMIEA
jgi:hypothetical protein